MSLLFAFFAITPNNYYRISQHSSLIAQCIKLNIVDVWLRLSLITSKQPFYTDNLYAINHILTINIEPCDSEYSHFHLEALLLLTL
jgi:hypothetical protein